jgi:hypothetical protein
MQVVAVHGIFEREKAPIRQRLTPQELAVPPEGVKRYKD